MRTSLAIAVVLPCVMGIVFVPFYAVVGLSTGNLQGVHLTAFAQRDKRIMLSFAVALLVVVVASAPAAASWRSRLRGLVVAPWRRSPALSRSLLVG